MVVSSNRNEFLITISIENQLHVSKIALNVYEKGLPYQIRKNGWII